MSYLEKLSKVLGSAILYVATILLPMGIERLSKEPAEEWLNMPWYYIVVDLVVFLLLILIWALPVRKEKDKLDEVINGIHEIKDTMKKLIQETREDRNERNKPKQ